MLLLVCLYFATLTSALSLPSLYAPISAACPSTPLVRPADGLSTAESTYLGGRKLRANAALKSWLRKTNSAFDTSKLPTVALTSSGGGYRALLSGAGVLQGFDARDSNVSTSGILQAIQFHAGLSGGAWLLSSFAGNNYPTITSLKNGLWKQAFQDSLLDPAYLLAAPAYIAVTDDILAKQNAGFPPTLTDPWGRLLSYQLLYGFDGGVATRLSSIASLSNFTSQNVPYPIITGLGVNTFDGQCLPSSNGTTYEITPFEFGSWDSGVQTFTPTKYLGTKLTNGIPNGTCIQNFDNLGYVLGTSSNLFNEACQNVPSTNMSNIFGDLAAIVNNAHALSTRDEYAVYPNPFHNYARSSLVSAQTELTLVDGGEAHQNNPIFPLLQPSRGVDVIIVNDNSADNSDNFPDGSEILTTYIQSLNAGLTKMPFIPSVDTFVSEGLNKRPTFFGCNDTSKITIVYLPNVNYTFPSNQPTSKLQYAQDETEGMIANGVQIASMGGSSTWAACLGCAFMKKTGTALPGVCQSCFRTYCYVG
jgi:lysophospholipase